MFEKKIVFLKKRCNFLNKILIKRSSMTRLFTLLKIFTIFWSVYFSFLFPCIPFRVHYLLVLMAFKKFNSFDESLQTAIDTFDDFVFHILNIGKCPNTFHKNTETWQKIIMGYFTVLYALYTNML